MSHLETPLVFECEGQTLVGIICRPAVGSGNLGVLVPVGGPQYRAGSHRQFVLLARRLAAAGYPVLRFDARGMGDATGDFPGFDALGPDLQAAARALKAEVPGLRGVVLWGLCDAASAAMISAPRIPGLAGMVLLNPWVRHADTHAAVEVKQYYGKRLFDPTFWHKLVAGRVDVRAALREVAGKLARMARAWLRPALAQPTDFRERMAQGAQAYAGPQLFLLSGRDHVAAEFQAFCQAHAGMRALLAREGVTQRHMAAADHTFSSGDLRLAVEDATLVWLAGLPRSA